MFSVYCYQWNPLSISFFQTQGYQVHHVVMDSDRLVTVQRVVSPVDCSAGPSNVSSMTHQETLAPQPTHAILTPVPVRHFIEITNTRSDDSLQKSLSLMSTEKKKIIEKQILIIF